MEEIREDDEYQELSEKITALKRSWMNSGLMLPRL